MTVAVRMNEDRARITSAEGWLESSRYFCWIPGRAKAQQVPAVGPQTIGRVTACRLARNPLGAKLAYRNFGSEKQYRLLA